MLERGPPAIQVVARLEHVDVAEVRVGPVPDHEGVGRYRPVAVVAARDSCVAVPRPSEVTGGVVDEGRGVRGDRKKVPIVEGESDAHIGDAHPLSGIRHARDDPLAEPVQRIVRHLGQVTPARE